MAMTSATSDGGDGAALVLAGDRRKAFRSAWRHSLLVRALRWLLPLSSVLIVAGYGLLVVRVSGWGGKLQQLSIPKVDPLNLSMENPKYEGYNSDGSRYVVVADHARQELSNLGQFKLDGIRARLARPDGSITDLIAKSGTYDSKTAAIELLQRIKVTGSNGLVAHLTQALVDTKADRVTSTQPVEVELPTANVRSRQMTLLNKQRQVTFTDDVRTHLMPPAPADASAAKPDSAPAPANPGMFGSSRGPIDVTSGKLHIDDLKRTALFVGDVVAVQTDSTLRTPEMLITYENAAPPGGAGAAEPGKPASVAQSSLGQPGSGRIDRIVAKGPVAMTRAGRDEVTADAMDYDGRSEIVTLTGNVVVAQPPDRRVTAARADYDSRADTVLLTGGVDVAAGRNELHGQRMFVDNKAGKTQLSSPAEPGRAAGRIGARFFRGAPPTPAQLAAKAASKASAKVAKADDALMSGRFATDPSAPIDVQSATLDVDDHAKSALFNGDVVAAQGDLTVKSAKMIVHYSGSAGVATAGAQPTKPANAKPQAGAADGGAQITRIEAREKVVVSSSKDGQTATGDWANYDAKTNHIELGGDVVMTQGKNVVRGTRLLIDMVTGESNIVNSPDEGWVARAGNAGGHSKALPAPVPGAPALRPDRPSAVFFPRLDKKGSAPDSAPPAAASGAGVGDAWSASTSPSGKR